jgi:hypothetical protein
VSQAIPFHPYAETYPLLDGAEYEAFKADIARGVREPVKYRVAGGKKQGLDGRNRLRACAELGIPCPEEEVRVADEDVEGYIDSLNLHRRHLTREQQRERIARKLKGDPAQSNREVARQTGADGKTVAKVREQMESTAEIPQLDKTKGKDDKERPAKQPRKKKADAPPPLPCDRCNRIGVPSCADCRKAFPDGFPSREPGDDTDTENAPAPKNGRPKPTFKGALGLLAPLTRHVEELRKSYGHSPHYDAIDAAERTIAEQLHAWQEEGGHA